VTSAADGPYAALLRFVVAVADAAGGGLRPGHQATRITCKLSSRPDAAPAAAAAVVDWSGGTRLGEGLPSSTPMGVKGLAQRSS
jgi:hypothetical protein